MRVCSVYSRQIGVASSAFELGIGDYRHLIDDRLTEDAVIADSGAYNFGMAHCDVPTIESELDLCLIITLSNGLSSEASPETRSRMNRIVRSVSSADVIQAECTQSSYRPSKQGLPALSHFASSRPVQRR